MPDHVTGSEPMEVHLDAEGNYLGANDVALAVLGYTPAELQGLRQGGLSRTDPETVHRIWREFVAGTIDIPGNRAGEMVTKTGSVIPVEFLGVTREPDGSFTSRTRLLADIRLNRPRALHLILDAWRAAELELAERAPDDPAREALEARVADLRALYQRESKVRSGQRDLLINAMFEGERDT